MKFHLLEIRRKGFAQLKDHHHLTLAKIDFFDVLPTWTEIGIEIVVTDDKLLLVTPSNNRFEIMALRLACWRETDFTDRVILPVIVVTVSLARCKELESVAVSFQH